jgi:hypothetical protein
MGYYLNYTRMNEPLPAIGKANILARSSGVEEISQPKSYDSVPSDKAIICVVNNGMFEAAGYAFCKEEFEVFTRPDGRSKRWFLMDKQLVNDLTGYSH